jgi:chromosome segregation ATPase
VQALALTNAHANSWALEATHGAHVMELGENNAMLLAELEKTRLALAEAETAQNSLSVNHGKLEEECMGLRTVVDTLGHEMARIVAAHEAEHKKFQDYRVHHCKKLCELRVNLEKAVNEIVMRYLPYLGKEVLSVRLSSGLTKKFKRCRVQL